MGIQAHDRSTGELSQVSGAASARVIARAVSGLGGFAPALRQVSLEGMNRQQLNARETQLHEIEILLAEMERSVQRQRILLEFLRRLEYVLLICKCITLCLYFVFLGALMHFIIATIVKYGYGNFMQSPACGRLARGYPLILSVYMYEYALEPLIITRVCGYNQNAESLQRPMPRGALLLSTLTGVFNIGLNVFMVMVAFQSEDCGGEFPVFQKSLILYCIWSIINIVCVRFIRGIGLRRTLSYMMRNGMLSSTQAAPDGTFEKQEAVKIGDVELGDMTQCSICLEDFSADPSKEIRRTTCDHGHLFHASCLQGWLKVGHSCPLCRQDLAEAGQSYGRVTSV